MRNNGPYIFGVVQVEQHLPACLHESVRNCICPTNRRIGLLLTQQCCLHVRLMRERKTTLIYVTSAS